MCIFVVIKLTGLCAEEIEVLQNHKYMPYKQIPRNRPIAMLVSWYLDKKSGKVTDARKEIQKRFDYLDWDIQKRIVLAFLQSGLTDRQWAYGKAFRQWDDDYQEVIRNLWERYHEYMCAWSVIAHFPIEYVKANAQTLEEVNGYYHLCQRLAEDSSYTIDRSKLNGKEYLLVMLNAHREISEEEARDVFFQSVHDYCLYEPEYITNVKYGGRGSAFRVEDIEYISSIMWIFHLLGLENLILSLRTWNLEITSAMYFSEEFKNLNTANVSDEEYTVERIAIGLKYLYLALDDKYKLPTDTPSIEKLMRRVERLDPNVDLHKRKDAGPAPLTREQREEAAFMLEQMKAQNPAVSQLITSMGLDAPDDLHSEEPPF